ncbi:hypothetical protein Zm00014a_031732 [Zea mays]|uniref:Uncharacterized protein n=1 Tax=Zea mays TaxID=4577 RepID=A0A3L6DNK5_MAIZE|nr:hypothetical protein Zm00014a_031732 [Zea mays]
MAKEQAGWPSVSIFVEERKLPCSLIVSVYGPIYNGFAVNGKTTRADAIQRNYGGSCVQMRLSFSSLAPLFLYFIQWLDCGCCYALPSYLGLFHILTCKETWVSCIKICYVLFSHVYADGDSSMSTYERRASLREFYGIRDQSHALSVEEASKEYARQTFGCLQIPTMSSTLHI